MAYLSLYRKYRSQTFSEVSGQDHVTRTLQNALRNNRVAHAYLFCGPRGTGKTSTARLLAKALNCEKGPTSEPCNVCNTCVEITEGRYLDMKEIDAASNRSIDDFRDLRDNVAYAPTQGRFTVYVIDEVHQVTGEAFNAFLKTLEEPPAHVVFIMATTEAHKIPATIVSRCQRFEFRRAGMADLKQRIEYVATQEGVRLEPTALDLIAREANGGFRDALSLLEQVMAFCEAEITARDVYTVLGTVESDTLHQLAESVRDTNGSELFRILEELIAEGKDPRQLLRDVTLHYRSLMLAAAGSLPPGEPDQIARISEQARSYGHQRLVGAIEVLAQTERESRWSEQPRLLLELALCRLMHPREAAGFEVRPAVQATAPRSVPQARPPQPQAAPPPSRPAAPAAQTAAPRPEPASPFVDEAPPVDAPGRNGNGGFGAPLPPPPLTVGDARAGDDGDEDYMAAFEGFAPPEDAVPEPPPARPAAPPREAAPRETVPPPAGAPPPSAGSGAPLDVMVLRKKWRIVMEELKRDRKMTVNACLADTEPDRFETDVLVIRFPSETMAKMFTDRGKAFNDPLATAIHRVTGIVCRLRAEYTPGGGGGSAPKPANTPAAPPPAPSTRTAAAPPPPRPPAATQPVAANPTLPERPGPPPARSVASTSDLTHDVVEIFDGQILGEFDN